MHLARVIPVKQVTIYNDLLRRKKLTVIAIQKAVDEAITNEDAARNHRNKLRPPREKRRDDWRRVLETTVSLVEEKADLLLRRSSLCELYAGMDVSRQEIREHIDSAIEKLESIRKQL